VSNLCPRNEIFLKLKRSKFNVLDGKFEKNKKNVNKKLAKK